MLEPVSYSVNINMGLCFYLSTLFLQLESDDNGSNPSIPFLSSLS
jgi:hypothetical protein